MNQRQRYIETINFGSPDKIPLNPGNPRESTLANWREQGLPENVDWFPQVVPFELIDQ